MSQTETPIVKRSLASALRFASNNYVNEDLEEPRDQTLTPRTLPQHSSPRTNQQAAATQDRLLDYLSSSISHTDHVDELIQVATRYLRRSIRPRLSTLHGDRFTANPLVSLLDELSRKRPCHFSWENTFYTAILPPSPPGKSPLSRLFPSRCSSRSSLPAPTGKRKAKTTVELFALALEYLEPRDLLALESVSKACFLFMRSKCEDGKLSGIVWKSVCSSAPFRAHRTVQSRTEFLRYMRNKARCILIEGGEDHREVCHELVRNAAAQCGRVLFELGPGGVRRLLATPRSAPYNWILPLFSAAKAAAPSIIYLPDTTQLTTVFNCDEASESQRESILYAEERLFTLIQSVYNDFHGNEEESSVVLIAYIASDCAKTQWQAAFKSKVAVPFNNPVPPTFSSSPDVVAEYFNERLNAVDHELNPSCIQTILRSQRINSKESVDSLFTGAAQRFHAKLQQSTHFRKNVALGKYEMCSVKDPGAVTKKHTAFPLGETRFGPLRRDDFMLSSDHSY